MAADGAVLAAARRDGRLVRVRCLRVQVQVHVRSCGTGIRLLLHAAGSTHSTSFFVFRDYWLVLVALTRELQATSARRTSVLIYATLQVYEVRIRTIAA